MEHIVELEELYMPRATMENYSKLVWKVLKLRFQRKMHIRKCLIVQGYVGNSFIPLLGDRPLE